MVAVRSYGLIGSLRLQLHPHYHYVIDSKDESEKMHDLRLTHPFPELVEYCESFDLSALPSELHSHVPYVVILYQAGKALENEVSKQGSSTFECLTLSFYLSLCLSYSWADH